jgi:hypothetical protein
MRWHRGKIEASGEAVSFSLCQGRYHYAVESSFKQRLTLVMNRNFSIHNLSCRRINVTRPDGELVGAADEIVHVCRESNVTVARNLCRAGKSRMIAGNRKARDLFCFKANASIGIVIVEEVSCLPAQRLDMKVEGGLSAIHRDRTRSINLAAGRSRARCKEALSAEDQRLKTAALLLGELYNVWGKPDQAARFR